MPGDWLILDRDVPAERERLKLGNNPLDNEEVMKFTLEADLETLSKMVKEGKVSHANKAAIKTRMKQAEEDKDKMSERGKQLSTICNPDKKSGITRLMS